MASVQAPVVPVDTVLSEPSDASLQNVPALQRLPSSSTPIEMNTIPPVNPSQFVRSPASTTQSSESSHYPQLPATDALPPSSSTPHTAANTTNAIEEAQQAAQQPLLADSNVNSQPRIPLGPDQSDLSATPVDTLYSPLVRETTAPAIGPATDKPAPLPKGFEAHGPVLCLTLLLTTGSRHPFKLDEKYLKKRNVEVEGNNPINLSLYKFKELILRDWREEWEPKPSSPESIRLISMGKLLGDKSKLADFGFKNGSNPHIIHMTIKPQEIVDEEDAKSSARGRERHERSPGCRCIIQ